MQVSDQAGGKSIVWDGMERNGAKLTDSDTKPLVARREQKRLDSRKGAVAMSHSWYDENVDRLVG